MTGRRVQRKGRYLNARGRRRREIDKKRGDSRSAGRLVICGTVFVLLVVIKLLFPHLLHTLSGSVGALMGRDADFREAFAAVGRAASGEESVQESLQDAYVAVFRPERLQPTASVLPKQQDASKSLYSVAGNVRSLPIELPLTEKWTPELWAGVEQNELDEALPEPVTDAAVISYCMDPLPDNASLELRDLKMAYTSPVAGALSSAFGWRDHPIDGGNRFHYGVDLAAEMGTDIVSFADGVIYATGGSSTLGKYVMVVHGEDYVTLYAHCSAVTKTGGAVKMGEKIAEVGDTGTATGPHLHFELHQGQMYLNPIYYVELR